MDVYVNSSEIMRAEPENEYQEYENAMTQNYTQKKLEKEDGAKEKRDSHSGVDRSKWACNKMEILLASLALHIIILILFIVCLIMLAQVKSDIALVKAIYGRPVIQMESEIESSYENTTNFRHLSAENVSKALLPSEPKTFAHYYGCAQYRRDMKRQNRSFANTNHVATLYPFHNLSKSLTVDCVYEGIHSWMVIQRRVDGNTSFHRYWESYANGFGEPGGEYWIGLRNLNLLTSTRKYSLLIILTNWENVKTNAEYSKFSIGDEHSNFTLTVSGYGGTAKDGLRYHNGMPFSTFDRDPLGNNCAENHHGAWWYRDCYRSNLNGRYYTSSDAPNGDGISWSRRLYSLKSVEMRIGLKP